MDTSWSASINIHKQPSPITCTLHIQSIFHFVAIIIVGFSKGCIIGIGVPKGIARGVLGARDSPFCKPFLTKQPATGGENAMTIS